MHSSSLRRTGVVVALAAGSLTQIALGQTFQNVLTENTSFGFDLVNTRDCGFQVIGQTQTNPNFQVFAFAARLTETGKVAWAKRYSSTTGARSCGYSCFESTENNELVLGCEFFNTGLPVPGSRVVIRTDKDGVPIWCVRLTGSDNSVPLFVPNAPGFVSTGVSELYKNRIAVIGRKRNTDGVVRIGLLSVLHRDGSLHFSKRYVPTGGSGAALDFIQAREAKDSSGEVLILGTILISPNYYAIFAMRTDADGKILWARSYRINDESSDLLGGGFDLAQNGDMLFSAARSSPPVAGIVPYKGLCGRIDALTGDLQWASTVEEFTNGQEAVLALPDDSMLVAGITGQGFSTNHFDTAGAVLRVGSSGHTERLWSYGDFAFDSRAAFEAIAPIDCTGGYAMFGRTQEVALDREAWTVRTDANFASGCLEEELNAVGGTIQLGMQDELPTVIDDEGYMLDTAIAVDVGMSADFRCSTSRCVGDLNADQLVDDSDFVLFADAYNVLVCPTNPAYTRCPSDFNGDGIVEDADFVLFASAYDQLICPP
ncbi:MAG: hypothetical protein J0L78_13800 [Planctomycetes bacterium]|nr:hypothetical protein [Planctomycetota bacterium]